MGPLASCNQKEDVLAKIQELRASCELVYQAELNLIGGDADKGAFVAPTVLFCERPLQTLAVHQTEVFGPATTILPLPKSR